MMTRRTLLTHSAAAAALTPTVSQAARSDPRELRMQGNEQIAMLLYPGFTALDFVGPYHFLAGIPGATVHLVTNQPDLRPVPSDLGMAVQPQCP